MAGTGEEDPRPTPPDEDVVHVDGRDIPFRTWEQELMLRAAAWVALVQGTCVTWVAGQRWLRWHAVTESWPLLAIVVIVGFGWVCVRSRDARRTLIVLGVLSFLLMASGGELPGSRSSSARLDRIAPVVAGLGYAVSGVLLLWRMRLARDLLLVLSGAWLLVAGPVLIEELTSMRSRFTSPFPPFQYGFPYTPLDTYLFALLLPSPTWLLPPAFVFLTMLSRSGRSLFVEGDVGGRLAPFSSVRRGPATARGWAAILVSALTLLGSAFTLDFLKGVIRELT